MCLARACEWNSFVCENMLGLENGGFKTVIDHSLNGFYPRLCSAFIMSFIIKMNDKWIHYRVASHAKSVLLLSSLRIWIPRTLPESEAGGFLQSRKVKIFR